MGKHSKSKPDENEEQNIEFNKNFGKKENISFVWIICSIGIFVVLFSLISVVFLALFPDRKSVV